MASPRGKWTVSQAAKSWNVTHSTILRWIRSGRLSPDTVEKVEETRGTVYFIKVQKKPDFSDTAFAPIPFVPRKAESSAEPSQSVVEERPEEESEPESFDYGDEGGGYEVMDEDEDEDLAPRRRRPEPEGPSMEELEAIEQEQQKPRKRRTIVR